MTRINEVINIKRPSIIKEDTNVPVNFHSYEEHILTDEQKEAMNKLMHMSEAEWKNIFDKIIKHPIDLHILPVIKKIE